MKEHFFSLVPFPDPALPSIKITGSVCRKQNLLTIHYSLTGNTETIYFPPAAAQPSRRDELWLGTCFELFLTKQGQLQYWEFNFSPSGHWNAYHMDDYRRIGFREERSIDHLQFAARMETHSFSAAVNVDLSPIIQTGEVVQTGITSVIRTRDGHETYWALAHPAPQADFHLRESFLLRL